MIQIITHPTDASVESRGENENDVPLFKHLHGLLKLLCYMFVEFTKEGKDL